MKIRNRNIIRLVARIVAWINRCLYATCRLRVIESVPHSSPYAPTNGEMFIYCNWHDGILNSMFCGKPLTMSALTSRHADGEYVAVVMDAIGILPIRGSNNHGGATAAKQLMSAASKFHVTITTDGPRGPRRVVKPGIVFLASQTGRRILPVACSGSNAWHPRGRWTDMVVPLPFSTAYVLGGVPMSVPPNLSKEELAPYRDALQRQMDELQERIDAIAAGREAEPALTLAKAA
ncbi:lysophospholipid acyltransferase family protein [Planctomicrobium piriforme]|uniref:DUF374 domain-containing protein n=1 Tax=Planctomicrobium piriforme TaxID=1576369 RepID=A0A1I3E3C1_9PLAN|nr:DUF374 domain-containing protein [Planctomicrobium piriforme]SFH93338.1 hypothetical protein SAMN05421753_10458 [Planctomicrobium piriforme]